MKMKQLGGKFIRLPADLYDHWRPVISSSRLAIVNENNPWALFPRPDVFGLG